MREVRLHASQPWPLQRGTFGQVMIGAYAVVDDDDDDHHARTTSITTAGASSRPSHTSLPAPALVGPGRELEAARWLSRGEVARALLQGVAFGLGGPAVRSAARPTASATDSGKSPTAVVVAAAAAAAMPSPVAEPDGDPFFVPGPYAIAHHLLRDWLESDDGQLPGSIGRPSRV